MPSRVRLAICLAAALVLSASCSNLVVPSPEPETSTPPTSSATPSAAQSQRTEDRQGPFQLVFELPKDSWRSDEAIEGLATLALIDGTGADLGGSGVGLIVGFDFNEINGTRHLEPVWTTDCRAYRLERGHPIKSQIKKSGGFSADQPDAAFYRAFLTDPIVHLPAGDWTITAMASFVEGQGCGGQSHQLKASLLVHVTP